MAVGPQTDPRIMAISLARLVAQMRHEGRQASVTPSRQAAEAEVRQVSASLCCQERNLRVSRVIQARPKSEYDCRADFDRQVGLPCRRAARGRANGIIDTEVSETIDHLAFYAGWPAALTAAQVVHESMDISRPFGIQD